METMDYRGMNMGGNGLLVGDGRGTAIVPQSAALAM